MLNHRSRRTYSNDYFRICSANSQEEAQRGRDE